MKNQSSHSPDLSDLAPASKETAGLRRVTVTTRAGSVRPPAADGTLDPYVGATVDGRYDVESVLGEGGMGVVYRCTHTIIGKKVAMKVLRADMARNEEVVGRFLNEARSASSIGNPHIIDISDFGRLPDGATYFVMEYLEGTVLSAAAENGPLAHDRIGTIIIQLAEALGAAHDVGIVHRDLKPENIFLVRRGSQRDFVKVLDFGIAKVANAGGRMTQAGQVFGTPHYMAPEQAAGGDVDHRADIYAVGVILYELVTGRLPFDADTFMGILSQHMYKEPEPPSTFLQFQRLDPDLERVILCCLKKDPRDRYQRMSELEADMRIIFGDPGGVGSVSRPELRATAMSGAAALPASAKPGRKKWPAALAVAVLLLAALAGFWFYRESQAARRVVAQPAPAHPTPPSAPASAPVSSWIAVAVEPLAAHVFRGEEDLGTSPVMIEIASDPVPLVARAEGFLPRAFVVDGTAKAVSIKLEAVTSAPTPAALPRPQKKATRPANKSSTKKSAEGSGELVNPWD